MITYILNITEKRGRDFISPIGQVFYLVSSDHDKFYKN
jgi:hypothetical protein